MELKRISPGSAFKVGGGVYAFMGLLFGGLFSLFGLLGAGMAGLAGAEEGFMGIFFGLGAIIFLPIFYGLIGAIFAAIGAAIYNLIAKWLGGLELDLQ